LGQKQMTNEHIRKLLGGYATNTLTESERKALFEAALEDQKLFDALQEEDALKELLSDAASRGQIRGALDEPRRAPWWSHRWTWASALAAAAVGILALVMIRPFERPGQIQVAPSPIAPANAAPGNAAATNDAAGKMTSEQSRPAPNEFPPTNRDAKKVQPKSRVARSLASGGAMNARAKPSAASSLPAPPPPSPAMTPRAQSEPMKGITTGSIASPLLRYSLVKRDASGVDNPVSEDELKSGDVVRIRAFAGAPGSLALYRRDSSGALRQVFPTAQVTSNSSVTLDWPIMIQNSVENFRVTLSPSESAKQALEPLVVDIQIGPKN
jgi:hypothetical protein